MKIKYINIESNVFPCACHKGMCGSGGIIPFIRSLCTRWRCGQLHDLAALPQRERLPIHTEQCALGRPQSQSESFTADTISLASAMNPD